MRKIKDFTRGKDYCRECYYADHMDFGIDDPMVYVMCKRNPTKVKKLKDQWCGEFIPYEDIMIH